MNNKLLNRLQALEAKHGNKSGVISTGCDWDSYDPQEQAYYNLYVQHRPQIQSGIIKMRDFFIIAKSKGFYPEHDTYDDLFAEASKW